MFLFLGPRPCSLINHMKLKARSDCRSAGLLHTGTVVTAGGGGTLSHESVFALVSPSQHHSCPVSCLPACNSHCRQAPMLVMFSTANTQTGAQCTIALVGTSAHHLTHTIWAGIKQIHHLLQLLVEILGLFSISKSKVQKRVYYKPPCHA